MTSAFITGANRGIGLETAKQLSKKGLFVYLGTRTPAKGEAIVEALSKEGFKNIKAIELDITSPDTIRKAVKQIDQEQGKLDILINNAGISRGFPDSALITSVQDIQSVFDTNFFGTINVTQAFLDLLKKSEKPRISNISTGLASLTMHNDPSWKYYPFKMVSYVSSKVALNAFTVMLAYELRDLPFKVNAIDPGYTSTDFNQHRGPGSVESAAAFIIKHTLNGENAPSGKFYSKDMEAENEESPW